VHRLSNDPRYKDVAVFTLDYDNAKDVMRRLKVSDRASVLAFKGKAERARMVNETGEGAIRKVFDAAL
jgi:hypothetical protein